MKLLSKILFTLVIVFLISCESPSKVKPLSIDYDGDFGFKTELLNDGEGNWDVAYQNGSIRSDQVRLEWHAYKGEDFVRYTIERDNIIVYETEDSSNTSFTDEDDFYSSNNYYFLLVHRTNGTPYGDRIKVRLAQWDAPANITVNQLASDKVLLQWEDNSDTEDSFEVFLATDIYDYVSYTVPANTTEQIISELDFGKEYYFYVVATSRWEYYDVESSHSDMFEIQEMNLQVSSVSASVNPDKSVLVAWHDYSILETGYSIERKINNGQFIEIATIAGMNIESYLDEDNSEFEYHDELTYRIRCYNDFEDILYSNYSNEYKVTLYNPAEQYIRIQLTANPNYLNLKWNIKDMYGVNYFSNNKTFSAAYILNETVVSLMPGNYTLVCYSHNGAGYLHGDIYQEATDECLADIDFSEGTEMSFEFTVEYDK